MKNKEGIFIFLLMLGVMFSCRNSVNVKSTEVIDRNIEFEDLNIKQYLHPQDSFLLSDLKKNLGKSLNNSSIFYSSISLQKPYADYWNLLQDSNLVINWNYKFSNRADSSQYITLDVFVMKQNEYAANLIDGFCDDERIAELSGKKAEYLKETISKGLPYKTFKDGDVIYVLNASKSGLSFLDKGFAEFREDRTVLNEDIVPSERIYIIPDMKKRLEPHLKKWLEFYDLNLDMFYGGVDSNQDDVFKYDASTDTLSVYYNAFGPEYDLYNPVLYDYSPDKNNFLVVLPSAGVYQEEKDGKYYYYGGDDCSSIWLVQRKLKKIGLVRWNGSVQFTEAAFWLDNKTFVLISTNYYSAMEFQIQVFGKENYSYSYRNGRFDWDSYGSYFEHEVKSRGVITDL